MKAYWINTTAKKITAVEYEGLTALQHMVSGYIELAKAWPTGDVMFVNEEGLLFQHDGRGWFRLAGIDRPFYGSGVVVGREVGDTDKTEPPRITLEELERDVEFLSDDQARAWAKANASDPAVMFIDLTTGESETMASVGELFQAAPPTKPKE
jgi:hypothetical protein